MRVGHEERLRAAKNPAIRNAITQQAMLPRNIRSLGGGVLISSLVDMEKLLGILVKMRSVHHRQTNTCLAEFHGAKFTK